MNGRVESDLKIKRSIDKILVGQPIILRQYLDNMSQNTWITKKDYVQAVKMYFDWLRDERGVKDITVEFLSTQLPLDINAYMAKIKYITDTQGNIKESSSSKQAQAWSALKSFYEFLYINEFIKENPVAKTRRPKNTDAPCQKYLSQEQMKKLIKKIETENKISYQRSKLKPRDLTIIKLLLTTGMRAEPLIEINIEDIDFEHRTVSTINKGHKIKEFELIGSVMESLDEWLQLRAKIMDQPVNAQSGPLLVTICGERLGYWGLNNVVKTYTKLIGIKNGYSCHKMRHSYGTAVYSMTKDIDFTRKKLGHKSINTTQRYVNEVDDKLDDIVNSKLSAIVG
ncbi:tyrosine-type recombinase/integrase [Butyrivibrio sp. AE3004]|uniref:tyrosine-type recombinase/integrase n=1 Tax=Butyrivibrio sp. AE3004 TaxID=1506994 RepID=UPI0004942785|nr:tyrosine-type recombinase/integrase [Butyrivibrio sp. AE3004]